MNFKLLQKGVPVANLLAELEAKPHLWDANPLRLFREGPHWQTHDIWLRYKDDTENKKTGDYSNFNDPHHPIWYPPFYELPATVPLLFGLMAAVQGEHLGGALIYSIPPGKEIFVHSDPGWHAHYHAKFNFALQSQSGCSFYYPDTGESMEAETGDLHWFRNTVPHGVKNNSDRDQIILTCTIHTRNFSET